MKIKSCGFALAFILTASACSSTNSSEPSTTTSNTTRTKNAALPPSDEAATDSLSAVASADPDLSLFVTAIGAAGLKDTLSGVGPYTVLAPSNSAFATMGAGVLEFLLAPENSEALKEILLYHVLTRKVMSTEVTAGSVVTLQGKKLVFFTEPFMMANNAKFLSTDIEFSSGVIHKIDKVLIPEDINEALAPTNPTGVTVP